MEMKMITLVLISILSLSTSLMGWTFRFANYLNEPVKVRIQLVGINEPWYEKQLAGGQTDSFNFVTDPSNLFSDSSRKAGFCLNSIQLSTQQNGVWQDWKNATVYKIYTGAPFDQILQASKKPGFTLNQTGNQLLGGMSLECGDYSFSLIKGTDGYGLILT